MTGKITAILAAILLLAAGGAVFVYGGSLSGSVSDSETSASDSGDSAVPLTDEDDSEVDDSAEWTGTDVVTDGDLGITLTYVSGTEDCYAITQNITTKEYTVTFSGMTEDTVFMISGTLNGCVIVDADDGIDFKLGLNGVIIVSSYSVPISCSSGNNLVISAIAGTSNTVTDNRSEQTASGAISSCIYSVCNLKIQGQGELTVASENNNGIHTKGDLRIRNLTLNVTCVDNALKGNDSVSIKSGIITLTAESGDGIVTTSTDTNTNGIQRGTVTINSNKGDTVLVINAYCDGIDAAFDVVIEETEGNSVSVTIKTYTGATASSSSRTGGGWGGNPRGGSWGQPGPDSNKSASTSFSCKGIKADNSVNINGGTVSINAYDDAIHANSDVRMESTSSYGKGNVYITGGTVTLASSDDAIHADGGVFVTGGGVDISQSYEGIEGSSVTVSGGSVYVRSSDDGINSSGTITLSGGYVMIYAGGDGIDSNCTVSYKGIVFSGAVVGIVSTSGGNSAIDTDRGYTYSGGKVLAICPQGMTSECLNCSGGVSGVGKYSTISASSGAYLTVKTSSSTEMAIKMPVSLSNAFVIHLGSNSVSFTAANSVSGVYEVTLNLYA